MVYYQLSYQPNWEIVIGGVHDNPLKIKVDVQCTRKRIHSFNDHVILVLYSAFQIQMTFSYIAHR